MADHHAPDPQDDYAAKVIAAQAFLEDAYNVPGLPVGAQIIISAGRQALASGPPGDTTLASRALALIGADNGYVNVGLRSGPPTEGRAKTEHICAITALPADLDAKCTEPEALNDPELLAAIKKSYVEELLQLAAPPNRIIETPHGVQPWWFLDRPYVIDPPGNPEQVENVKRRWQLLIRKIAAELGVDKFDDIATVTRIMRLPGTGGCRRAR